MDPVLTTLALMAWGLVVKYVPQLKNVPNRLLPYMNLVIAVLIKIAAPQDANAGLFGGFFTKIGSNLGWLLPFIQTILARQVYETWGRPTAEMIAPKIEKKAVAPPI